MFSTGPRPLSESLFRPHLPHNVHSLPQYTFLQKSLCSSEEDMTPMKCLLSVSILFLIFFSQSFPTSAVSLGQFLSLPVQQEKSQVGSGNLCCFHNRKIRVQIKRRSGGTRYVPGVRGTRVKTGSAPATHKRIPALLQVLSLVGYSVLFGFFLS